MLTALGWVAELARRGVGGRRGRRVAVPSSRDTRQEMLTLGGTVTGPGRPEALKRKRTRRQRARTRATHSRSEFRAGQLACCLPACRVYLWPLLLRLQTTF